MQLVFKIPKNSFLQIANDPQSSVPAQQLQNMIADDTIREEYADIAKVDPDHTTQMTVLIEEGTQTYSIQRQDAETETDSATVGNYVLSKQIHSDAFINLGVNNISNKPQWMEVSSFFLQRFSTKMNILYVQI